MPTTTKKVLCPTCEGSGVIRQEELTCYHKGEYDVWFKDCPKCDGVGLLIEQTQITYTKYQKPKTRKEGE